MDYNQINIPKPKGLWRLLFIIALFLVVVPFLTPKIKEKISAVKQSGIEQLADKEGYFTVVDVLSGDTIELLGGVKVKYIGIDIPDDCYINQATDKNKELLINKKVKLIADINGEDENGNFLRYAYLPDGTFINLELIKNGYATVVNVDPNLKFKDEFEQAEKEAIVEKKGLWGECIN
jgi:micrococcal nuclease